MIFRLFQHGLLRTPQFSFNQSLEQVWSELKQSIKYASKSFYEIIEDVSYKDISSLDDKTRYTIWKYYNRARFRATPFGHFAAFSLLECSRLDNPQPIIVDQSIILHSFLDWPFKDTAEYNPEFHSFSDRVFQANETIYYTDDEIRYIFRNDKSFEIGSIDYKDILKKILSYCKTPIREVKLIEFINEHPLLAGGERLIEDLLAVQLIYTDSTPNIIGQDYFHRVKTPNLDGLPQYVIAERRILSGYFSQNHLRHLNNCISCLLQVNEPVELRDLQDFKTRFLKTYGSNYQVSLIEVLDPEIGIGYGHFAHPDDEIDLSEFKPTLKNMPNSIKWGPLEMFLMEGVVASKLDGNHIIQLEQFKIQETERQQVANTFSALCTVADGLVNLQVVGGSTANSLLGRFSLADGQVREMCKSIARIESESNPDMIFFDVAYLCETKADNVNRRSSIYEFEMPILVYSTCKNPIQVNDVLISMYDGQIVLYSKKFEKRLIPRVASAYNHQRSDLALYRLLCDLQSEGLQTDLSLDISRKIPGLSYYPRVQYKNIVLCPAKWKIELKRFIDASTINSLEELHVSTIFNCGHGDQILFFDRRVPEDLDAFNSYLRLQQEDFYIEEVISPKQAPSVIDQNGFPYHAQYLVSLFHKDEIFKEIDLSLNADDAFGIHNEVIYPGNDWVYFEIYCSPLSTDTFFTTLVLPFIEGFKSLITKWFFVRYLDPEHHLRLRIQLVNDKDGYEIIRAFSKCIKPAYEKRRIYKLHIKEYTREIHRYGISLIEEVETHFYLSSIFSISIIKKAYNHFQKYHLVHQILLETFKAQSITSDAQLAFTRSHEEAFVKEHQWTSDMFSRLNKEYRKFDKLPAFALAQEEADHQTRLLESIKKLLGLRRDLEKSSFLSDLIHMLVNRLFREDQRIHEAIIYYFLNKLLLRNRNWNR